MLFSVLGLSSDDAIETSTFLMIPCPNSRLCDSCACVTSVASSLDSIAPMSWNPRSFADREALRPESWYERAGLRCEP